jgi:hypothetical protein
MIWGRLLILEFGAGVLEIPNWVDSENWIVIHTYFTPRNSGNYTWFWKELSRNDDSKKLDWSKDQNFARDRSMWQDIDAHSASFCYLPLQEKGIILHFQTISKEQFVSINIEQWSLITSRNANRRFRGKGEKATSTNESTNTSPVLLTGTWKSRKISYHLFRFPGKPHTQTDKADERLVPWRDQTLRNACAMMSPCSQLVRGPWRFYEEMRKRCPASRMPWRLFHSVQSARGIHDLNFYQFMYCTKLGLHWRLWMPSKMTNQSFEARICCTWTGRELRWSRRAGKATFFFFFFLACGGFFQPVGLSRMEKCVLTL